MSKPILVAYATKHESTHEVADAIAARMRVRGASVEVRPVAEVETLEPYGAVILGGALYAGRWHRAARRFVDRHRDALAHVPLAVFAMGPLTLESREVESSRRQLERALAKVPELSPVSLRIFGGALDPDRLPFPLSRMEGADARDWDAISAWAEQLAALFGVRTEAWARATGRA
jgi:menaquinone-dependent protoporphyrinogen oxidase